VVSKARKESLEGFVVSTMLVQKFVSSLYGYIPGAHAQASPRLISINDQRVIGAAL
jgi:hypothetical protein